MFPDRRLFPRCFLSLLFSDIFKRRCQLSIAALHLLGRMAAVIRGAAAEQKVRELKVENQQLQQKIPSYVLISILSAFNEGEFTLDEVQVLLQTLFDRQYILTEDVEVEVRYRTETRTGTTTVTDPNYVRRAVSDSTADFRTAAPGR